MKMKKLLLACSVVGVVASCGGGSGSDSDSSDNLTNAAEPVNVEYKSFSFARSEPIIGDFTSNLNIIDTVDFYIDSVIPVGSEYLVSGGGSIGFHEKLGHGASFDRAWLLRLDENGNIVWQILGDELTGGGSITLGSDGDIYWQTLSSYWALIRDTTFYRVSLTGELVGQLSEPNKKEYDVSLGATFNQGLYDFQSVSPIKPEIPTNDFAIVTYDQDGSLQSSVALSGGLKDAVASNTCLGAELKAVTPDEYIVLETEGHFNEDKCVHIPNNSRLLRFTLDGDFIDVMAEFEGEQLNARFGHLYEQRYFYSFIRRGDDIRETHLVGVDEGVVNSTFDREYSRSRPAVYRKGLWMVEIDRVNDSASLIFYNANLDDESRVKLALSPEISSTLHFPQIIGELDDGSLMFSFQTYNYGEIGRTLLIKTDMTGQVAPIVPVELD
tara:strand:- start:10005 stop:11324 length:1320 start_codon:yes stop_codon:yes gene_type:complete